MAEEGDQGQIIALDSEQAVWNALDGLLKGEIDSENVTFDLSKADWAGVRLIFDGEPYHGTVPTSAMKGIVEFQDALHRSVALVLRDKARIRNLAPEEVEQFELVFKVKDGSSDFEASAAGAVQAIGEKALDRMSPKDVKICALVMMGLFWSLGGGYLYSRHTEELAKTAAETRQSEVRAQETTVHGQETLAHEMTTQQISKDGLEHERILADALKVSEKARTIKDESDGGYDAIIRHADRTEYVILQGTKFSKERIEEITKRHRRSAKKFTRTEVFRIVNNDTSDPTAFVVRLRRVEDGAIIVATLDDAVGMEKFKSILQRGEWNRTNVTITYSGRTLGDEVRDARILKAHTTRQARGGSVE